MRDKAGISPGEFIGVVAGVAYALAVGVSEFIGAMARRPEAMSAVITSASCSQEHMEKAIAALE